MGYFIYKAIFLILVADSRGNKGISNFYPMEKYIKGCMLYYTIQAKQISLIVWWGFRASPYIQNGKRKNK